MEAEKPKKESAHHVQVNPIPSEIIEAKSEWTSSLTPAMTLFPVSSTAVDSLLSIAKNDLIDLPYAEGLLEELAKVLLSRRSEDPEQLLIDHISSKRLQELQSLPHHRRTSGMVKKIIEEHQSGDPEGKMENGGPSERKTTSPVVCDEGLHEPVFPEEENLVPSRAGEVSPFDPDFCSRATSVTENESGTEKPLVSRLCSVGSCKLHRAVLESVAQLIFVYRPSDVEDFLLTRWEGAAFCTADIKLAVEGQPRHQPECIAEQLERLISRDSVGRPVARHAIDLLLHSKPDNPINFLGDYYASRLLREEFPVEEGEQEGGTIGPSSVVALGLLDGNGAAVPTGNSHRRESLSSHGSAPPRASMPRNYSLSSVGATPLKNASPGNIFNGIPSQPQRTPYCYYYPFSSQGRRPFPVSNDSSSADGRFSHSLYSSQRMPRIPEVFLSSTRPLSSTQGGPYSHSVGAKRSPSVQFSTALHSSIATDGLPFSRDLGETTHTFGHFATSQGIRTSFVGSTMATATTGGIPSVGNQRRPNGVKRREEDLEVSPNSEGWNSFPFARFTVSPPPGSQPPAGDKKNSNKDEKMLRFASPAYASAGDRTRPFPTTRPRLLDSGIGYRLRTYRTGAEVEDGEHAESEGRWASLEEQEEERVGKREEMQKPFPPPPFSWPSRRVRTHDFAFSALQRDLWSFELRSKFRLTILSHEVEALAAEKHYREKALERDGSSENYCLLQSTSEALEDALEHLELEEQRHLSTLQFLNHCIEVL